MKTELYPFQKEGVAQMERFLAKGTGVLLADAPGLGKTIQALTVLANHPEWRPAVIVCPASIKGGWERQASQHLGMRVTVLGSRSPENYQIPPARNEVFCINYDVLSAWADWLIARNPKVVVADECHFAGNKQAQRTKALKKLVSAAGRLIAISGTPMTNNPVELWPVLNMIDPEEWNSFHGFTVQFTHRRRTPWGWDYKRPKDLDCLHERLTEGCMVRRLKSEVLKDLPAMTTDVVPVMLSRDGRQEYNRAEKDFRSWLVENLSRLKAVPSLKAEAVTKVGHLRRLVARLKIDQMTEWVENFLIQSDEKIILFAWHRKMVEIFSQRFKNCAVVTGEVTGADRTRQFDRFNHDKDCRVFIGNRAAYEGWSASACSHTAFLELPWSPGHLQQASERTHGIGRGQEDKRSMAHLLVAANTYEEKLCQLLDYKSGNIDQTLNGGTGKEQTGIADKLLSVIAGVESGGEVLT